MTGNAVTTKAPREGIIRYIVFEDAHFISLDIVKTIRRLRPGFRLARVVDDSHALDEALKSGGIDLVVADLDLDCHGLIEVLERRATDTPAILISAYHELSAYASHSDNMKFILKPFAPESLDFALSGLSKRKRGKEALQVMDKSTNIIKR